MSHRRPNARQRTIGTRRRSRRRLSDTPLRRTTTLAVTVSLVAVLLPAPAVGLLGLGGLLGGIGDLLSPVTSLLDRLLGTDLDGLVDRTLQLDLDDGVAGLVDGAADLLTGAPERIGIDLGGVPLVDGRLEVGGAVPRADVLDGAVEDVLVPGALAPLGDVLGSVTDPVRPLLRPIGSPASDLIDRATGALPRLLAPLELDAASYRVRTTYGAADVTTRDGVIDTPTLIDADRDGLPDLSVEVRFITAEPSLRVTRLPTAPSDLPAQVEVVLAPGGWAAAERVAFGLDARDSQLPDVARITLTEGLTGGDRLAAALHTVGAADRLAVVASTFEVAGGTVVDPTDVRLGLSPVPADLTVTASGVSGGNDLDLALTSSSPTRVDVDVTTVAGATTTTLGGTIDRVPETLALGLTSGGAETSLRYVASAPVAEVALRQATTTAGATRSVAVELGGIDAREATFTLGEDGRVDLDTSAAIGSVAVELIDPDGVVGRATRAVVRLVDLPTGLTVDLGDDGAVGLAADGLVGSLEALLTSGPEVGVPEGSDGVVLRDTAEEFVVAVRLTDLRSAALDPAPAVTLETAGGRPFVADVVTDEVGALVTIDALPTEVALALHETDVATTLSTTTSTPIAALRASVDLGDATITAAIDEVPTALELVLGDAGLTWTADARTPRVEVDAVGLDLGRADRLSVRLRDLAPQLTVGADDVGMSLDAPAGIGELVATFGDGRQLPVPTDVDGVLLRDDADGYAVAARLTDLERLAFDGDAGLTLDTAGGQAFTADVATDELAAVLELDVLPASVALGLVDGGEGFTWSASDVVPTLSARLTNADLDAVLAVTDLPQQLAVGFDGRELTWAADQRTTAVDLDVTGDLGAASQARIRLRDLPRTFAATLDAAGGVELRADAPLGSLEAQLTDGPDLSLPEGVDGLLLREDADGFVAFVRVTGLTEVALDATPQVRLVTAGGRRFLVDVEREDVAINAELDQLPEELELALEVVGDAQQLRYAASAVLPELRAAVRSFGAAGESVLGLRAHDVPTSLQLTVDETGQAQYVASSRLPLLEVSLESADALLGRATDARLRLDDVPQDFSLGFGEDGALRFVAADALGSLEAQLTDGGEDQLLPDGVQGVKLVDTAEGFVAAARVEQLRRLEFLPTPALVLETAGGATFLVDVLTEDDAGDRLAVDAALVDLPSRVELELVPAGDPAAADGGQRLRYAASRTMTRLTADLELQDADGTTTFGIEALDLPTELELTLDPDGALTYAADQRVDELTVVAGASDGIFAGATQLQARLVDLPLGLTITLGDDGAILLEATGGRLGSLDALATSGPELGFADGVDGLRVLDDGDDFAAAVRITGLDRVAVGLEPLSLELATAGGRSFLIDADLGGDEPVAATVAIADLPPTVALGFSVGELQELTYTASRPTASLDVALELGDVDAAVHLEGMPTQLALGVDVAGQVAYSADARVPLLALDAVDPAGLFGRATDLGLRLEDLPTGLSVQLDESGALELGTTGGPLGLLEALATNGPDRRLAAQFDGALVDDLAQEFVVFARFTAITSASLVQDPLPEIDLRSTAGRLLHIALREQAPAGGPITYTEATLDRLVDQISLSLAPSAGGLNVRYRASATTNELAFATNSGDRQVLQASLSDVPRQFDACQGSGRACIPSGATSTRTGEAGSFSIATSSATTLDLLDRKDANAYTQVEGLRVRKLAFDAMARSLTNAYVFLDTDNQPLQGEVTVRSDSRTGFNVVFGSGFRAQDRLVRVSRAWWGGPSVSRSGSISCGSNSKFDVRQYGVNIPLAFAVC